MKRFTETDKWRDSWFRKLTAEHKLAYLYALDNCDAAGVWEADYELAEFVLGCKPDWPGLIAILGDRLEIIRGGKWWLNRFISYQYGTLSEDCKPHQHVLKVLKSHTLSMPFRKGIHTLKDKDKDKERDKDNETEEIRQAYPAHKRVGKPATLRAISKALDGSGGPITAAELLEKTKAYALAVSKWPDDAKRFVPNSATWFNDARFNDPPETWERKDLQPSQAKPDRINFAHDDYTGISTNA